MSLQFKIKLKNVSNPLVWRRVIVPEKITFEQFHFVIQQAFGLCNCHLWLFSPIGYKKSFKVFVPSDDDFDAPDYDASTRRLTEFFVLPGQKWNYIYDFGDNWVHEILLEDIIPEKLMNPICIGGKGKCPPEDCGGPYGYEHLKEVLKNPEDGEYQDMLDWLGIESGEEWNVDEFI